jgi:glycosyltransferase involved in cell wall biosynthesis
MILAALPKWNDKISGVEYHRILIPLMRRSDVIFTSNIEAITQEFLIKHNINQVWFNRNIAPFTLNPDPIYKTLKKMGIKIVIDLDDTWNIPFGHTLYWATVLQNRRKSALSQIIHADYVVTTHKHLANEVYKETKFPKHRIYIAPNGIDPKEPQYDQDFKYNLKNIFWQGSVTHDHDLKLISSAVNELDLRIFIAGRQQESRRALFDWKVAKEDERWLLSRDNHLFDNMPFVYDLPLIERWEYFKDPGPWIYHWDEIGNLFNKKQFINHLDSDCYMNAYQNKGITLIPLEKTSFTACKSNIKMLESGWAMKPVIVSPVNPYLGLAKDVKNCLHANNKGQWIEAIEWLLEEPNFAEDLRLHLHEDVKENYLIDKVNQARNEIIDKINKS